jgi:hypothetical protein
VVSGIPESVGKDLQFHLIGFATEEAASVAGKRVGEVIEEVVQELEISIAGLDGVTIAHDYDSALAQLDRGYKSERILTRTDDKAAGGVAMTPCVLRDGKVMSHMVLSTGIIPLIDNPVDGVSGKYIIAHELSHAHEHYFRDKVLPNTLLQQRISDADEIVLFEAADACWGEYAACYFSAPIHPHQAKLYEMTLVYVVREATERIVQAKRQWMADRDIGKMWQQIASMAGNLLKYASYLLGHAVGLNKSVEEIAPEGWQLLQLNSWLLPAIEKLDEVLSSMLNTFEQWKGLDVFEPLKQIMRGLLADCGFTMSVTENGSLYIWVGQGKLPV